MLAVLPIIKSGANYRNYPKSKALSPAWPQSNRLAGTLGKTMLATSFIYYSCNWT